jgi:hypothetical protein
MHGATFKKNGKKSWYLCFLSEFLGVVVMEGSITLTFTQGIQLNPDPTLAASLSSPCGSVHRGNVGQYRSAFKNRSPNIFVASVRFCNWFCVAVRSGSRAISNLFFGI